MKHILFIIGARPNFMKFAPVYEKLKLYPYKLTILHTGQHYDPIMSDVFLEQFGIDKDNIIYLNTSKESDQIDQLAYMMIDINSKIKALDQIDLMITFGDVTSTLAGTLVGQKNDVPLAHIESGNRSFDNRMPEEINRIITDSITTYFFISEPNGVKNLESSGLLKENNFWYVGNPMIDTLFRFRQDAKLMLKYKDFGLEPKNYILMTIHRPSNVDDPSQCQKIIDSIKSISKRYKILFPIHHRKRDKFLEQLNGHENIILIDPQGYVEFISLMIYSGLVITDSGGLQEETTALKIPCITLRENTERPITLTHGTNILVSELDNLIGIVSKMFNRDYSKISPIDLWDGRAGERIAEIINVILR